MARLPSPDPGRAAVLYSGGSDSTLAALRAGERFREVHLLTFRHRGIHHPERSERNVPWLRSRFRPDPYRRPPIVPVDRLFRHLAQSRLHRNLARHGFFVLTTCGQCKLAMHLRALVYALEHGASEVWDGANRNMRIFPFQMAEVLELLDRLYERYGLRHRSPVFELDDDQGTDFGSFLWGLNPARRSRQTRGPTSSELLHAEGLLPSPRVKGTREDKRMQARCYQFVLFNLWARWGYLQRRGFEDYRRGVVAYYREQFQQVQELLDAWLEAPHRSRLGRLLEGPRG